MCVCVALTTDTPLGPLATFCNHLERDRGDQLEEILHVCPSALSAIREPTCTKPLFTFNSPTTTPPLH